MPQTRTVLQHDGLNRLGLCSPSEKLTIISIGSSMGWSTNCWLGYDDAYTLGLVWNTVGGECTTVHAALMDCPPNIRP